eukprot:gene181-4427_t
MSEDLPPSLDVPSLPSLEIPDSETSSVHEIVDSPILEEEKSSSSLPTNSKSSGKKKKKNLSSIIPKESNTEISLSSGSNLSAQSLTIPTFTPIGGSDHEVKDLASPMPNVVGSSSNSSGMGRKKPSLLFRKSSVRGTRWKDILSSSISDTYATLQLKQLLNDIEQIIQNEQISVQQKKKWSSVKLLTKLEELTYFQLSNFFLQDQNNQIQLWKIIQDIFSLNIDDRIIIRLLYFFILNYLKIEDGDLDTFIFLLKKEITTSLNTLIKIETIYSLSKIQKEKNKKEGNEILKEMNLKILKKLVEIEKEEKKSIIKQIFKSNTSSSNLIKEDDLLLLKSCLNSIKNIIFENEIEKEEIIENYLLLLSRHKNEEISKESIILLFKLKFKNLKTEILPKFKLEEKKSGIPNFKYSIEILKDSKKNYNTNITLNDNLTLKVYFLKLLSLNFDNNDYLICLLNFIHDLKTIIFLDTIKIISKNNFSLFFDKKLIPNLNHFNDVLKRFSFHLNQKDNQLNLHATLKSIQYFLKNFLIYLRKEKRELNEEEEESFDNLIKNLKSLLIHEDKYIRFQSFKCLLWSPTIDDLKDTLIRLKLEIKQNLIWNSFDYFILFKSLLDCVKIKLEYVEELIDLIKDISILYPQKLDTHYLMKLFIEFKNSPQIIEYFLKMLFNILDFSLSNSIIQSSSNLDKSLNQYLNSSLNIIHCIFSFLGEYSNKLTNELSTFNLDINIKKEIMDKSILANQDNLNNLDTFDIQNLSMKSIILRMMKSSLYSSTFIRICCIEGLSKIAFRSLNPIRLYIYEFFMNIIENDHFGISYHCFSVIHLLDELFELDMTINNIKLKHEFDVEIISNLFEVHQQVIEKISFFSKVTPNYLPLGENSIWIINEIKKLK